MKKITIIGVAIMCVLILSGVIWTPEGSARTIGDAVKVSEIPPNIPRFIILVVDTSGSMPKYFQGVRTCVKAVIENARINDYIVIASFDTVFRVHSLGSSGSTGPSAQVITDLSEAAPKAEIPVIKIDSEEIKQRLIDMIYAIPQRGIDTKTDIAVQGIRKIWIDAGIDYKAQPLAIVISDDEPSIESTPQPLPPSIEMQRAQMSLFDQNETVLLLKISFAQDGSTIVTAYGDTGTKTVQTEEEVKNVIREYLPEIPPPPPIPKHTSKPPKPPYAIFVLVIATLLFAIVSFFARKHILKFFQSIFGAPEDINEPGDRYLIGPDNPDNLYYPSPYDIEPTIEGIKVLINTKGGRTIEDVIPENKWVSIGSNPTDDIYVAGVGVAESILRLYYDGHDGAHVTVENHSGGPINIGAETINNHESRVVPKHSILELPSFGTIRFE